MQNAISAIQEEQNAAPTPSGAATSPIGLKIKGLSSLSKKLTSTKCGTQATSNNCATSPPKSLALTEY